jgi:DNA-binding transcriptional MerR regulator
MLYTIGEMAKLLGVAPSTLRYYDKEGLLPLNMPDEDVPQKYRNIRAKLKNQI